MKNPIIAAAVAGSILTSGSVYAQSFDGSFSKRLYIGIGAGQSNVEPNTELVDGLGLADDTDTAAQFTLGFDFSRRLTAELHYADLGTAVLTDGDGIEYRVGALSGLFYLWNGFGASDFLDFDGLDRRAGLSLYGRLGASRVENESVGDVQFERVDDVQLVAGLGLEFSLGSGLGVRAEFINFDKDANYSGLTVLYRFGSGPQRGTEASPPIEQDELPTLPEPSFLPAPPPLPTVDSLPQPATVVGDGDNDGITDELDRCLDTPPGTKVDATGCGLFSGTLEGVNFLPGSDTLTAGSRQTLDDAIQTLRDFPAIRISVNAHTDSAGSEAANRLLSRNRALTVVRYLTAQGIPVDRLEARAFGESRPIADNSTQVGRLLNRRVEFVVLP